MILFDPLILNSYRKRKVEGGIMIYKIVSHFVLIAIFIGMTYGTVFGEFGDVVISKQKESLQEAGIPAVIFPHWFHRIRFKCKVCHESIFISKAGANDMNMSNIAKGAYCGKCHNGKIAWDTLECPRCHMAEGTNLKETSSETSITDPKKIIYLDSSGKIASTGNIKESGVAGNIVKLGKGEHVKALSPKEIPRDKFGLVDWVKLADAGLINPAPDLDPSVKDDDPMDLNILLVTAGKMEDVVYPHKVHTWWLNCDSCHDQLFTMETGATDMNMSGVIKGDWCGRCHAKVAFPLEDCMRCHVKPKSGAKKAQVIQ